MKTILNISPMLPSAGVRRLPGHHRQSKETSEKMDEHKKKLLEEQLRELFLMEEKSADENRTSSENKPVGPRVIRRRKGAPDLKIA
jgi:hypothetical protein